MLPTIDTAAHGATQAPGDMDVFDADGDEYATLPAALGSSVRSFRASHGTVPDASGDIGLSHDQGTRAGAHLATGDPDERRQDTTANGHPSTGSDPVADELYANTREAVALRPVSPPDRPRAGWTGADPTRAAEAVRPLFLRLWDKLMAEHPSPVTKGDGLPAPVAATPRPLDDLAAGFPHAGGSTGTQRAGVGPHANTARVSPPRWDQTLPSAPAVSVARTSRSFRA